MIAFYNTIWQPITQCYEGDTVYVARLMLSPSTRTCTVTNGAFVGQDVQPFPPGRAVLAQHAQDAGKVLLMGGWNEAGYFNLGNLYALHDWYRIRAGTAGTLSVQIGGENGSIPVLVKSAETNRVYVEWREVHKTRTLPVMLLRIRFEGDVSMPFKLYPQDCGVTNIEWIDIEPVGTIRFSADVGRLTDNNPEVPLLVEVTGTEDVIDLSTEAVVFGSTM